MKGLKEEGKDVDFEIWSTGSGDVPNSYQTSWGVLGRCFLFLFSVQCEIKLVPKRSRLESRPGDEDEGEDDSDSEDETSAKDRYFGYLKQGLYFVTEMERFAPPRKRPRSITKNFRLVSLRSTTPEELYQRKVSIEGKVIFFLISFI